MWQERSALGVLLSLLVVARHCSSFAIGNLNPFTRLSLREQCEDRFPSSSIWADGIAEGHEAAAKVFDERGDSIEFLVGTMIEIPRAALTADLIAQRAEFF